MLPDNWLFLLVGGFFSGLLAGLLGIGGGIILVPFLSFLNYQYGPAVGTSSLAIVITSMAGSFQNWLNGYLSWKKVIFLGLPGTIAAFLGAYIIGQTPQYILYFCFGVLLLINIYLSNLRQKLATQSQASLNPKLNPTVARILTGSGAGLLSGIFGVGGGVIMVPLQMLLLGEKIKVAIQTSLGAIMITSISACLGHYEQGNIVFLEGIFLGFGGLVGVQISSHFLPKLPDKVVGICFNSLLVILACYFFFRAYTNFNS